MMGICNPLPVDKFFAGWFSGMANIAGENCFFLERLLLLFFIITGSCIISFDKKIMFIETLVLESIMLYAYFCPDYFIL